MGRPIKKIFIGERAGAGTGGESLASVTLGGTNNSTGYTAADALTIGAPDLEGGVQAVGEVTVYANGALLEGVTTFTTLTGTETGGGAAFTGVTQKSTSGTGTGAIFTITTSGNVDYSATTIAVTGVGSGYNTTETITISGADIGGADGTNDLTFTIATFVTNGTISGTSITTAGSGYTSAPTVSAATGTQGTLTLTGVLTTGSTPVIKATAYVTSSNLDADIIAQKGDTIYKVTTSEGTLDCNLIDPATGLAHGTPAAVGEMQIIATDSGGATYSVTKLYNGHVRLENIGGSPEFADGVKVKWAEDGVAVVNYSVSITA